MYSLELEIQSYMERSATFIIVPAINVLDILKYKILILKLSYNTSPNP